MCRRRKWAILAFWLLLWQLASLLCGNSILLTGPLETALALVKNVVQLRFWQIIGMSYLRILTGLLLGVAAGVVIAMAARRYRLAEEILQPFMTLIKAVPVASFTVLLLIWWGAQGLSVGICFLVVLPHIYVNTLEGLKSTDQKLLEMAGVFHLPLWNRFFYIYRPALRPFLESGLKISIGMAWKSGVAAEVIGTPDYSMGERLYLAKIYLETADVLAWTSMVILLSVVTERIFMWLLAKAFAWEPGCRRPDRKISDSLVCLKAEHIYKGYNGEALWQDYSQEFRRGEITYFRTPSGSGKTTLFRMLAGLEQPDDGRVSGAESVAVMFQEDRLCEAYSAVKNVELVTGDAFLAREELLKLLPSEALDKPVARLSGGMRRRVALVRAIAASADCCLLDEPFTGLDEENVRKASAYIARRKEDRAILVALHDKTVVIE